MRCLLDTHLLIWLSDEKAHDAGRLDAATRALITDPEHDVRFSVVGIWEVAIKSALRRPASLWIRRG